MNYFYSDVAVCGVLVFLRTVLNCFICELFGLMTARSIKYLLTYLLIRLSVFLYQGGQWSAYWRRSFPGLDASGASVDGLDPSDA